jgi:hypothetical protein
MLKGPPVVAVGRTLGSARTRVIVQQKHSSAVVRVIAFVSSSPYILLSSSTDGEILSAATSEGKILDFFVQRDSTG